MKRKTGIFVLTCILLLGCVSCAASKPSIPPEPFSSPEASVLPAPTLPPTPEPVPPDITLGYWETNSYHLSDGLIYQFKSDGSYESWFMNGAFSPSGLYTYENWILTLLNTAGQKTDQLYYALETGQFISTMTEHIVNPEYMGNNGVFIPAKAEPTTLTCREDPTVSNPGPPPEPSPSAVSVNLSDPAVYRSLNLFLSNFSECNFSSFSAEAPDHGKIADFAFMHAWINSPSVVEDCSKYFNDEYADIDTCVSVSYIEKVAQRFFAGEVDVSSIEAAWRAGHGRGLITNGAYGTSFTLTDSVTDLGGDRFEVQFHAYRVPFADYPTYDCSATSDIYSARPDALPSPLFDTSQQFVGTPGSATIEAEQNEDGSLTFLLYAYTI